MGKEVDFFLASGKPFDGDCATLFKLMQRTPMAAQTGPRAYIEALPARDAHLPRRVRCMLQVMQPHLRLLASISSADGFGFSSCLATSNSPPCSMIL
jgi:hypothetical protein